MPDGDSGRHHIVRRREHKTHNPGVELAQLKRAFGPRFENSFAVYEST